MAKNNSTNQMLVKDSIFIIGNVSSIEGRRVKVRVNKNKNVSHLLYNGDVLRNVGVGSYVKIMKGFVEMIGKVEGEFTTNEKIVYQTKDRETGIIYEKEEDKIARFLEVSLFGHYEGDKFIQGIKEMPLIDNEVFLVDKEEFDNLHKFYEDGDKTINIGHLTEEPSQKIDVSIDKLFASHIGIFGNTGSGKSNTLARIYGELFEELKDNKNFKEKSKFVLIDFNGEYSKNNVISNKKEIYKLSTDRNGSEKKFPISEQDLLDVELLSILSMATEKTQKPFIKRAVRMYKKIHKEDNPVNEFKNKLETVVKLAFKMSLKEKSQTILDYAKQILDIQDEIEDYEWNNKNDHWMPRPVPSPTRQISDNEIEQRSIFKKIKKYKFPNDSLTKFIHILSLQIMNDLYNNKALYDHIGPAIGKLLSTKKDLDKLIDTNNQSNNAFNNKNIIVVDLKSVNPTMTKIIPLLVVKKLYDEHKDSDDFKQKSLHIIIDEAHNILSDHSERESETWKDYRLETFEEIIKEGRKFNVFLTVASQRPYDISKTILSQLHNYFIHRLINDFDINAIHKTVAYLDKLSFESIPVLSVGSCFFSGLATNIPVKVSVQIPKEGKQPKSETIKLTKDLWKEDR